MMWTCGFVEERVGQQARHKHVRLKTPRGQVGAWVRGWVDMWMEACCKDASCDLKRGACCRPAKVIHAFQLGGGEGRVQLAASNMFASHGPSEAWGKEAGVDWGILAWYCLKCGLGSS